MEILLAICSSGTAGVELTQDTSRTEPVAASSEVCPAAMSTGVTQHPALPAQLHSQRQSKELLAA